MPATVSRRAHTRKSSVRPDRRAWYHTHFLGRREFWGELVDMMSRTPEERNRHWAAVLEEFGRLCDDGSPVTGGYLVLMAAKAICLSRGPAA